MSEQKASLQDVLNYTPQTSLTEWEVKLIKDTFKDNDALLNVIRKVMLPSISDPSLPVEEFSKDMFFAHVDWAMMPENEIKPTVLGLQKAAQYILGSFIKLKVIANMKDETDEQRNLRRKKDSSQ